MKALPKSRDAARKAICMDVLAQLKAKRIKACSGDYLTVTEYAKGRTLKGLQAIVKCEACALGSMFVAFGTRTGKERALDGDMRDALNPYFTRNELYDIENAFEGRNVLGVGAQPKAALYRTMLGAGWGFYDSDERWASDEKALTYIMSNIIRNGRFIAEDLRSPKAKVPYGKR